MNSILQLKGQFHSQAGKNPPGLPTLPTGARVTIDKIKTLKSQLEELLKSWEQEPYVSGALISVRYIRVVAKSHRIRAILAKGSRNPNEFVVGARFVGEKEATKHEITYHVSFEVIKETLTNLNKLLEIFNTVYVGQTPSDVLFKISPNSTMVKKNPGLKGAAYEGTLLGKTKFLQLIRDLYFIDEFTLWKNTTKKDTDVLTTIFNTGITLDTILRELGITTYPVKLLDENTGVLTADEFLALQQKVPYLIAMAVADLNDISPLKKGLEVDEVLTIPSPQNEPVIGVIDTLFDEKAYFSEWVEYHKLINESIEESIDDKYHGTAVTSIIVDGPTLNPHLDDRCGRFRVRHFGVALGSRFSSFSILRNIENIVKSNQDIHVWNLSLGSSLEIEDNFISFEASILDELQTKYDVIFVVAGTNKTLEQQQKNQEVKMGAPADSIHSIVVNSVDENGHKTDYTRIGPALSFFIKPDISYYGGIKNAPMAVWSIGGKCLSQGTSLAAPWISRKLAYLIEVMKLNREVAKALLIDAALGWKTHAEASNEIGYGVVPISIEDIIKSPNNEIKFVIEGVSKKYDTYNYNLPVPVVDDEFPFLARATLCYFPKCNRQQGVDYTNVELDVKFGRIQANGKIKDISGNVQANDEFIKLYEDEARKNFRKWDTVKVLREELKQRSRNRKCFGTNYWGIRVLANNRFDNKESRNLRFGLVVTLHEMQGVNRIETFIAECSLRGWLVQPVSQDVRMELYQKAEEEIKWD